MFRRFPPEIGDGWILRVNQWLIIWWPRKLASKYQIVRRFSPKRFELRRRQKLMKACTDKMAWKSEAIWQWPKREE